jgi:ribonuclease BN (tRNA processing enzyme)
LVVDMGYGTLPRLLSLLDGRAELVDAVVITHAHPDHVVDLHGLYRARRWADERPGTRLRLLAPAQVPETLARIDPEDPHGPSALFDWTPLPSTTDIGPWRLTSLSTPHHVENVAVRLDGVDGSLVVTGDSGVYPPLEEFCRGCDLLICEATDRNQRQPGQPDDPLLKTAADAGRLASGADVGRLVLTHIWPNNDRARARAEAAAEFDRLVDVADENSGVAIGLDRRLVT